MNAGLASWLGHPVTITLVLAVLTILVATSELLLRSLTGLGNVRFQGILQENPGLFRGRDGITLSHVVDVGRWLQIVLVAVVWLVVARVYVLSDGWKAALAVGLPLLSILILGIFPLGIGHTLYNAAPRIRMRITAATGST